MKHLIEVASDLEAAQARLDACERAQSEDKASRRPSPLRRLYDYLFDTAAEKSLHVARDDAAVARAEATKAVEAFVRANTLSLLSSDTKGEAAHSVQVERVEDARKAERTARRVLGLARKAKSAFDAAADACSSASTMEMMDAFSSNKGISMMSSLSNSSARSAVEEAKDALTRLQSAVPSVSRVDALIDMPDDFLDLALDFAFDLPFDFLSWSNKATLDAANEKCVEASAAVETAVAKLSLLLESASARVHLEDGRAQEIVRPYLAEAAASVPLSLAFAVPTKIDASGR